MSELIGRDDETRPRLADFASTRGVQLDQVDLAPSRDARGPRYRHFPSFASNAGAGVAITPSSGHTSSDQSPLRGFFRLSRLEL